MSECTGVIISSEVVVTAGHCIHYLGLKITGLMNELDPKIVAYVQVGKISRYETDAFEVRYSIKTVQEGAYYTRRGFLEENPDFARLWVSEPIEFNDYVQPVCILKDPDYIYRLTLGTLFFIGNGRINEFDKPYDAKKTQWIQVKYEMSDLKEIYYSKTENRTKMRFLAHDNKYRPICAGDSGGPLVTLDKNKRWSLIGIAVQSDDLCQPSHRNAPFDTYAVMAKIVGIFDKNFKPGPNTSAND